MLRPVLAEALTGPVLHADVLARIIMPPIDWAEPAIAAGMAQDCLTSLDAALTVQVMSARSLSLVTLCLPGEAEIERRTEEIPPLLARLVGDGLRPRNPETLNSGTTDR